MPLATTVCALRVDFGSEADPDPVLTVVVEPVVVWVPEVLVPVVPGVELSEECVPEVVSLLVVVPVVVVPVVVVPVPVVDSPAVEVVFDPVSVDPLVDEDEDEDDDSDDDEPEVPVVSAQARP